MLFVIVDAMLTISRQNISMNVGVPNSKTVKISVQVGERTQRKATHLLRLECFSAVVLKIRYPFMIESFVFGIGMNLLR